MSLLHYEQAGEQKNMLISIDNRLEDITDSRGGKLSAPGMSIQKINGINLRHNRRRRCNFATSLWN
jgi:hypothetical protein